MEGKAENVDNNATSTTRIEEPSSKMMLPMTSLATAAAGAAVVVLSGASISNMYEMFTLARNHNNKLSSPRTPLTSDDMTTRAANWKSIDEAIDELHTMNRRDLISLYLDCEHPDVNDLAVMCNQAGEDNNWVYDGYLLSNGPILVRGCSVYNLYEIQKQSLALSN
jgi:hypothetical protein